MTLKLVVRAWCLEVEFGIYLCRIYGFISIQKLGDFRQGIVGLSFPWKFKFNLWKLCKVFFNYSANESRPSFIVRPITKEKCVEDVTLENVMNRRAEGIQILKEYLVVRQEGNSDQAAGYIKLVSTTSTDVLITYLLT